MKKVSYILLIIWLAFSYKESSCNPADTLPTQGLVAYYPFNGNSNDESGNGNNATDHGATLTSDRFGNPGRAYSFNGVNNYIEAPDNPTLRFNSGFTISFWVSFTSFNFQPWDIGIIGKTLGTGFSDSYCVYYDWHHWFSDGYNSITGGENVYYTCTPGFNYWNHIVSVFDKGSDSLKLYFNGVLAAKTAMTNPSFMPNYDGHPLVIGSDIENETHTLFINGKLDDIRLYNRVLGVNEVQVLYHEGGWDVQTIPTLSQWGLILLTLSLISIGTFYIIKRRRPLAPQSPRIIQ